MSGRVRSGTARALVMLVSLLTAGAGAFFRMDGGSPARADMIYSLTPSIGVGATDNALGTANSGNRLPDEFGTASLGASARYRGPRASYTLGYIFAYTHFLHHRGIDTLTNLTDATALFRLSAVLDLSLLASVGLSRTSSVDATDLTLRLPQGMVAGSTLFLTTSGSETLSYQSTARGNYTEAVNVTQLRFIDAPPEIADTTFVTVALHGSRTLARDTFLGDLRVIDAIVPAVPGSRVSAFEQGHTFTAQLMAGWQRELSPSFGSLIEAGPAALFKLSGPAVIAPAGLAALSYRRLPWFAGLSVSQTPLADLYLGEATIADSAQLRAALPFDRREQLYATVFGSFVFARVANNQGSLTRAYDARTLGASLTARSLRIPLAASLQFETFDQNGGTTEGRTIPDLMRTTVVLTVSGVFAFGPGTPPLFRGAP